MAIINGINIKKLRVKEGMSQEKLSKILGVHQTAISKWEIGEAMPTLKNVLKILEVFQCDLSDLLV